MSFLLSLACEAQTHRTTNPAFDAELARLLTFSVPLMSVEDLQKQQDKVALFDAREKVEYDVSHIPGAAYLGYENFDPARLGNLPKDNIIVLYCSVGYRSEKIGEKLKAMGYRKVFNLYGSIFEWANKGYALESSYGKTVKTLHTYNEEWSKWVTNPKLEKKW
jgi:rhodanese-related sulfurtransferase